MTAVSSAKIIAVDHQMTITGSQLGDGVYTDADGFAWIGNINGKNGIANANGNSWIGDQVVEGGLFLFVPFSTHWDVGTVTPYVGELVQEDNWAPSTKGFQFRHASTFYSLQEGGEFSITSSSVPQFVVTKITGLLQIDSGPDLIGAENAQFEMTANFDAGKTWETPFGIESAKVVAVSHQMTIQGSLTGDGVYTDADGFAWGGNINGKNGIANTNGNSWIGDQVVEGGQFLFVPFSTHWDVGTVVPSVGKLVVEENWAPLTKDFQFRQTSTGGTTFYSLQAGGEFSLEEMLSLGDLNCDGAVDLLDVQPFVNAVLSGEFVAKADINQDGVVDLLDVEPFVLLLVP